MALAENDISGLSQTYAGPGFAYQEVFLQEETINASTRWPLIADVDALRCGTAVLRPQNAPLKIARGGFLDSELPAIMPSVKGYGPPLTIVAFLGSKGGVGRSTAVANIASSMAYGGLSVAMLDLDPQNTLVSHFGMPDPARGIARATLKGGDWDNLQQKIYSRRPNYQGSFDLKLLPYGVLDEEQIRTFEHMVSQDPRWLMRHLEKLHLPQGTVVLVDLPAQSSMVAQQVLRAAHIAVGVSLVDAASYLCLARDEALVREHCIRRPDFVRHCHLFNQVDHQHGLEHDLSKLLRSLYGRNIAGFVHRDQSVREALAWHATTFDYQPGGQATLDFNHAATYIAETLAVYYGPLMKSMHS